MGQGAEMQRLRRNGLFSVLALCLCLVLLPAQDPARGRELFEKRCTGCHALDKVKEGPPLGGVYGRTAGSVSTFAYSDALKQAQITWDAGSLNRWLTDPEAFIPGNDMGFQLNKPDERAHIIAYLKQISGK